MTVVEVDDSIGALGDWANLSGSLADARSLRRSSLPVGNSSGVANTDYLSKDHSLSSIDSNAASVVSRDQSSHSTRNYAEISLSADHSVLSQKPRYRASNTTKKNAEVPSENLDSRVKTPQRRQGRRASLPAAIFSTEEDDSIIEKSPLFQTNHLQPKAANPRDVRPRRGLMLRMASQPCFSKSLTESDDCSQDTEQTLTKKRFGWKVERPSTEKKLTELKLKVKELELEKLNQKEKWKDEKIQYLLSNKEAQKQIKHLTEQKHDLESELKILRSEVGQFRVKEQVYVLQIKKVTKENDDLKKKLADFKKIDTKPRPAFSNFQNYNDDEENKHQEEKELADFKKIDTKPRPAFSNFQNDNDDEENKHQEENNIMGPLGEIQLKNQICNRNEQDDISDVSSDQLPGGPFRGVRRFLQHNRTEQQKQRGNDTNGRKVSFERNSLLENNHFDLEDKVGRDRNASGSSMPNQLPNGPFRSVRRLSKMGQKNQRNEQQIRREIDYDNASASSTPNQLPNGPFRGVRRLSQMGQAFLENQRTEQQIRREIAANRRHRRRESIRRQRETSQREAMRRDAFQRRKRNNLSFAESTRNIFDKQDESRERKRPIENQEHGFKIDEVINEEPPKRGLMGLCQRCRK